MTDDNQATNEEHAQEIARELINKGFRDRGFVLVNGEGIGLNQYEDLKMYNLVYEVHCSQPVAMAEVAKAAMEAAHRRGVLYSALVRSVILGHN